MPTVTVEGRSGVILERVDGPSLMEVLLARGASVDHDTVDDRKTGGTKDVLGVLLVHGERRREPPSN